MKMKYRLFGIISLGLIGSLVTRAQEIVIKETIVEKSDNSLVVGMVFDLSQIEVASDRSVTCTPAIRWGDSIRALPQVIINGRSRHILYERTGRNYMENKEIEVQRRNGKEQVLDYQVRTPFARWMEKSEVVLMTDLCGCGWQALENGESFLFAINLSQPVELKPVVVYQIPLAETVKARAKEGSAFLDFPVSKTEINPAYRNNPQELEKIRQTIESVQDDKYATITEVYIKGYASPEGDYKNNAYLAENRAKALCDYVKSLYRFENTRFTVDFEPEDWQGLEKAIEAGDLPDKKDLLAVVRAATPVDPDAREWKLKTLGDGSSYKKLLRDVYPALRHSDYVVKYTIRNFAVEEAEKLLYTDPKQLSLNEMFQVAQTYEPGSSEFNDVFGIAVRMFPDDPVSNLNAASAAIRSGQVADARRYLIKTPASVEKQLVEAAIDMLEGRIDEAEQRLLPLKNHPVVGAAANENLQQISAKRDEL